MLNKIRNLRALRPGQWARITIPDYECWREEGDWREVGPGGTVDACIMPIYAPVYRSQHLFEWRYRAAFRRIKCDWPCSCKPRGGPIVPSDLGMVEAILTRPLWTEEDARLHRKGQGVFLYEPASDDPGLCPGEDCSLYLCDTCQEYRMPWSDDEGNLVCPDCDLTGLVIDLDQVDRLEEVREFARSLGLQRQLERQLCYLGLGTFLGARSQCRLGGDFAPHSFGFCHYILPADARDGKRTFAMNGGLIYSGPGSPGDGSFPALSVNLHSGVGWFRHT
jgi:hypothetical protein